MIIRGHLKEQQMSRKQPEVPVKRTIKQQHKKDIEKLLEPKTQVQSEYINALKTNSVIVCTGPAGTGKTFCAAAYAAIELHHGNIEKIIVTRPNVGTGKSVGFFPGTIEEKMAPWVAPITSVIKKILGDGEYECHVKHKNIETPPLEVIRGSSWDYSIILVDESQNLTREELKLLSTRIGKHSKLILMGDISQSDNALEMFSGASNPLDEFCDLIEKHDIHGAYIIEFDIDDVVRSDICAAFVRAYYKENL